LANWIISISLCGKFYGSMFKGPINFLIVSDILVTFGKNTSKTCSLKLGLLQD
jgi:hypothetical protein